MFYPNIKMYNINLAEFYTFWSKKKVSWDSVYVFIAESSEPTLSQCTGYLGNETRVTGDLMATLPSAFDFRGGWDGGENLVKNGSPAKSIQHLHPLPVTDSILHHFNTSVVTPCETTSPINITVFIHIVNGAVHYALLVGRMCLDHLMHCSHWIHWGLGRPDRS